MKTTAEYQALTDAGKQEKLKKESFDKWTTYLYLHNSNQKKYGTLMKTFHTQYSLGNNQYCGSITAAADVLTNHVWDAKFKQDMKRKHQQHADAKEKNDIIKEEQSHAKERALILSLHVFVVVENIFYQIVRRKTRFQRKIGQ